MYPWAAQFKGLGWIGFATMFSFLVALVVGARLLLEKGSPRMGELKQSSTQILEPGGAGGAGFATTRLDAVLAWAQKYSLFKYPFVTACCGMEFMAVSSPRYDIARFGAEAPRFSPRQADLLWVVGTITPAPGARS